jgi:hypothetical protein
MRGEIKMQNFYKAVNAMWEGKEEVLNMHWAQETFLSR